MIRDPWCPFRIPQENASLRLACVPPAGKGCSVFRGWQAVSPAGVEILGIQFPGRETRLKERSIDRVEQLADGIAEALAHYDDQPLALFGHCFGAVVAFEVARRLSAGSVKLLAVSSCKPPHLLNDADWFSDGRSEQDILRDAYGDAVADLPEELLIELRPSLLADLVALSAYRAPERMLDIPVQLVRWTQDPTTTPAELASWSNHGHDFSEVIVDGNREALAAHGARITGAVTAAVAVSQRCVAS